MKSGEGYLLDTCMIFELIKAEPSPKVMEWIDGQDEEKLHLSVITLGEIVKAKAQKCGLVSRCHPLSALA